MPSPAIATGRWEITIKGWHPTRLNRLLNSHWASAGRAKKRDLAIIARALWVYTVPAAKGKRRVRLVIMLGKGERAGDTDAYFKSTLDALKHLKLIKDDNRQWVELSPVQFERGLEKSTTIILEDME